MMKFRIFLTGIILCLMPMRGFAQIDAIIDAVVDAVEPTPVYDTGMIEATQDLASKIDRLNRVLFGGAEETSAAYRYKTMYSDLYQLTTAFSDFVSRSYNNAKSLERMYSRLDGESTLHDYADLTNKAWYTYESTVRNGSRIIEQFKKIFSDSNTTNKEVREAAKEAIAEMNRQMEEEDRRVQEEIASIEIANGLLECAEQMYTSPKDYVEAGRKTYGETIDTGGTSSSFGTIGSAVMWVILLLCIVYTLLGGVHIMKGTTNSETVFVRILVLLVISVIVIAAIQKYI